MGEFVLPLCEEKVHIQSSLKQSTEDLRMGLSPPTSELVHCGVTYQHSPYGTCSLVFPRIFEVMAAKANMGILQIESKLNNLKITYSYHLEMLLIFNTNFVQRLKQVASVRSSNCAYHFKKYLMYSIGLLTAYHPRASLLYICRFLGTATDISPIN